MISYEITPEKALDKLMVYCSKMERSSLDVQKKLRLWNISEGDSIKILNRLTDEGFLSQERYIEAYVRGKFLYNKWGKIKIQYNLKLKGFKEGQIQQAFDELLTEEQYIDLIKSELLKKSKSIKESDIYIQKKKLLQFSQSRGYEIDIALSCIESLINKNTK